MSLSLQERARLIRELAAGATEGPWVYDLREPGREFIGPLESGTRSFGFPAFRAPQPQRDLVVLKRPHGLVLYLIIEVEHERSVEIDGGCRFWYGSMNDVFGEGILTQEMAEAVHSAGICS